MSTKASLAWGEGWQVYQDWMEPGLVMLEIRTEHSCSTFRFTIKEWKKLIDSEPQDLTFDK